MPLFPNWCVPSCVSGNGSITEDGDKVHRDVKCEASTGKDVCSSSNGSDMTPFFSRSANSPRACTAFQYIRYVLPINAIVVSTEIRVNPDFMVEQVVESPGIRQSAMWRVPLVDEPASTSKPFVEGRVSEDYIPDIIGRLRIPYV